MSPETIKGIAATKSSASASNRLTRRTPDEERGDLLHGSGSAVTENNASMKCPGDPGKIGTEAQGIG